jgi:hypothetical protein
MTFSNLKVLAVFVAIPLGIILLAWSVTYGNRPMFANKFGRGEAVIPTWHYFPAVCIDSDGVGLLADEHLNLIVVFNGFRENDDNTKSPESLWIHPSNQETWGGCEVRSDKTGEAYSIPRTSDAVIVFSRDGTRQLFALHTNLAVKCNRLVATNRQKLQSLGIDGFIPTTK